MLSGESAMGADPCGTVQWMGRIISEAEEHRRWTSPLLLKKGGCATTVGGRALGDAQRCSNGDRQGAVPPEYDQTAAWVRHVHFTASPESRVKNDPVRASGRWRTVDAHTRQIQGLRPLQC